MSNIAIMTNELTKKYSDVTAVNKLDLTIYEGELFSLLGVNGAGKTTTIKMLSCLINPTEGNAKIFNYDLLKEKQQIKQLIAVSPQQSAIAMNLSVRENIELMAGVHGADRKKSRQKADEIINEFHLTEVENKYASKLSGGWQRRLSIAMALVSEPKILFLDEPTLGLDVIARRELWTSIRQLKGKITIILTTHYMEEAESLSDRLVIMKSGKKLAEGTVEEINNLAGKTKLEDSFINLIEEA